MGGHGALTRASLLHAARTSPGRTWSLTLSLPRARSVPQVAPRLVALDQVPLGLGLCADRQPDSVPVGRQGVQGLPRRRARRGQAVRRDRAPRAAQGQGGRRAQGARRRWDGRPVLPAEAACVLGPPLAPSSFASSYTRSSIHPDSFSPLSPRSPPPRRLARCSPPREPHRRPGRRRFLLLAARRPPPRALRPLVLLHLDLRARCALSFPVPLVLPSSTRS